MRKITAILLFVFASTIAFGQSNEVKAKAEYFTAQEAFEAGNYTKCLSHLKNTEDILGSTNARILYLQIKSLYSLKKFSKIENKRLFDKFFNVSKAGGEEYKEILRLVSKIDEDKKQLERDVIESNKKKALIGERRKENYNGEISLVSAGTKYNEGNDFYRSKDFISAVYSYETALDIANKLGVKASELRGSIKKMLMNSYFKAGLVMIKNSILNEAILYMNSCYSLSVEIGSTDLEEKSVKYLGRIHTSKGISFLNEKMFEDALLEFEKAITYNPKDAKAYYGKGKYYLYNNDIPSMLINMHKCIKFGSGNAKNTKFVEQARKYIEEYENKK